MTRPAHKMRRYSWLKQIVPKRKAERCVAAEGPKQALPRRSTTMFQLSILFDKLLDVLSGMLDLVVLGVEA